MWRGLFGLGVLLLIGCDTLPGQPASYPADRPIVPLGGNKLVALQAGQIFTYSFSVDNRTNGVKATGTSRQIITNYQDAQIPAGIAATSNWESQDRTQNGNPLPPIALSFLAVYVNDAQGYPSLIVASSLNGVTKYVVTPSGGYPGWPEGGALVVGDGLTAGPVQFTNGTSQTCSYIIVGVEIVDTPMARFETFRFEWSCTQSDSNGVIVSNNTAWVHPAIGEVKVLSTSQGPAGFVVTTLDIVSTNVPY